MKINWNRITTLIALFGLLITIMLAWNQKSINILNNEVISHKNQIDSLRLLNDPDWYGKLNEQRDYYDNLLIVKNEEISKVHDELDSVVLASAFSESLKSKGYVIYTEEQDKFALISIKKNLMFSRIIKDYEDLYAKINASSEIEEEKGLMLPGIVKYILFPLMIFSLIMIIVTSIMAYRKKTLSH